MMTLSSLPGDPVAWLMYLGGVSLRGTLLLAVAAVVCLALRRSSAALRHLVWVLAILSVLCLPVVSLLHLRWQVRGLPRIAGAEMRLRPAGALRPPLADDAAWTPAAPTTGGMVETGSTVAGQPPASAASPAVAVPPRPRPWSTSALGLAVWGCGATVMLLYALAGMLCVRRLHRRAHRLDDPSWQALLDEATAQLRFRRPVALLQGRSERMPMMWGWRHPVLLLPAGAETWPPERRQLVLLHELAHARRADWLTQLLGHLVRALHWFNPVVWIALRQLRREREQACDDLVLRSGFRASEYADHLLGIAKALPRPRLVEAGVVAMGHPAGIEDRIRGILDPLRSRRGVTRRGAVAAASIAAALLVAVASAQASNVSAVHASDHRSGLCAQWQPQTENDPRLSQRVHIEICGRAAAPALELLSKQTGVALQVLPENVETVGERKLTIIAQGCSLKSLLVQIPKALQECHWDVDLSGEEPVYLLHRNGGAEGMMTELAEKESARWQVERRPARAARLAEARRALALSPEELEELAWSDPFLAAAVEDPETRARLELLLSLPERDLREFAETGRAYMTYSTAPEAYRLAARACQESFLREAEQSPLDEIRAWAKVVLSALPQAGICFEDYSDDMGMSFLVQYFDAKGVAGPKGGLLRAGGGVALPARLPGDGIAQAWYRPLLLRAGYEEAEADAVIADVSERRSEQEQQKNEQRRSAEWREPRGPELHRTVTLPFEGAVEPVEVQRFIAKETGLSLVSDYFTTWGRREIPGEARRPQPVWRLLYALGDSWFWTYDWDEVGDCLVFRDRRWYTLSPQEFPESMVLTYREKLTEQGRLTLEDVAAAAVELARRRPVPPRQRGEWPWSSVNVPPDLEQAGLSGRDLRSEALLLYASLSPDQGTKARSAEGLPYAEMTTAQQSLLRPYAFFSGGWNNDRHPIPDGEIARAVYRVKQSPRTSGSATRESVELQVEFPSLQTGTTLTLLPPQPSTQPAAGGK